VTFSAELRQKIALFRGRLEDATDAFWSHADVASLYPRLLFRVHSIIRASVPVMEAAISQIERSRSCDDAVGLELTAYLHRHVFEEQHHAEWLLDDMATLEMDPDVTRSQMPSPTVAALVGAQYYWIHHHQPIVILGYIAVLEGNPPTVEAVEAMIQKTRLPRDAFRNYFKHARLDVYHTQDLDRLLDQLRLDEAQRSAICVNASQTLDLLARSLEELVELHGLGCPGFGAAS
jgi:hypothetical protein